MKTAFFIFKSFLLMSFATLFSQILIIGTAKLFTDQEDIGMTLQQVFVLSLVFGLYGCWVPTFVKNFMVKSNV